MLPGHGLVSTAGTSRTRIRLVATIPMLVAALVASCSAEPQPIRTGVDRCEYCLMGIAQERFAAELVTRTGKIHTFDSVECLAGFVEYEVEAADARSMWVTDYEGPPRLLDARAAFYIQSEALRSPMGLGFAAYADRATRDAALEILGAGRALDWDGVRRAVRKAWPDGSPHGTAAAGKGAVAGTPVSDATARGGSAERSTTGGERQAAALFSITDAIAAAAPGDRVVIPAGTYREPMLEIDKPIELVGQGDVVLDGEGAHGLIVVRADDVTIRGLSFRNIGTSYVEDRAAIRIENGRRCTIEDNTVENGFFGIYLASAADCSIRRNRLTASTARESASGNGIHLWYSRNITIEDNEVSGYRDGIYFEFVRQGHVARNVSQNNLRYGLHFMFSDSCMYEGNTFRSNGAGVAVMYAKHADMIGNTFADNWGTASFGLLLKDIRDSRIESNVFTGNTIGLYAEASDRLIVSGNDFRRNGWAIKLLANSENSRFTANNFASNSFDVATNSRRSYSEFDGNWWAEYRGYDLDHDGVGDVPHRPVRLFSLLVERNEPSMILMRSFLVQLLDITESVIPALTPETLVDARPLMAPSPRKERLAKVGARS